MTLRQPALSDAAADTRTERHRAGARTALRARPVRRRGRGSDRACPSHSPSRCVATSTVRPVGRRRAQPRLQQAAPVGVEAQARLVEHEDGRVRQVEHGEAEALPRAAREPAGHHVRELLRGPSASRPRPRAMRADRAAGRRRPRIWRDGQPLRGSAATAAGTTAPASARAASVPHVVAVDRGCDRRRGPTGRPRSRSVVDLPQPFAPTSSDDLAGRGRRA